MNEKLIEKVEWVRKETLKIHRKAPETRIASSLSPIDIFVSLFYGDLLKNFPKDPLNVNRDRLVISKGHGSICLYPILADLGFFDCNELDRVCQKGGILGGIPDPIIPGYETVNGSLGHGLGVATGIGLALRTQQKSQNIFVLCGDGELHEGSCWEAAMFASHHGLDNLNLIIDNNRISMLGYTDDIISHGSIASRFEAFGWDAVEVDGHNVEEVHKTIKRQKNIRRGKPKAIIANTKKGFGVPEIENKPLCHIINPKPETIDLILGAAS